MRKVVTFLAVTLGVLAIAIPSDVGASHAAAPASAHQATQVSAGAASTASQVTPSSPSFECSIQLMCQVIGVICRVHGVNCFEAAGASVAATPRAAAPATPLRPGFTCIGPPAIVCQVLFLVTSPICRKFPCGREAGVTPSSAAAAPAAPAVRNPLGDLCTVQTGRIPNPFCLVAATTR